MSQFIFDKGFLSDYNPALLDVNHPYQALGVDLSCYNNSQQPVYIDFKLKNSNNFKKSQVWSVEILKYTGQRQIQGWFIDDKQMTNIYCFCEANSNTQSWNNIKSVDMILLKKKMLISKIKTNSGKTIEEIKTIAQNMMDENISECLNTSGYFKKRITISDDLWLTMSAPDAGRPVINLCFNRDLLGDISAKTTIR